MGDRLPSSEPPPGVAERLEELRGLHVPERDSDARLRLATQRSASAQSFPTAVARRLAELRALCDLAKHLGRR